MSSILPLHSCVSIYVQPEGELCCLSDRDDECMKAIIESFQVGDFPAKDGQHIKGPQVKFQLRDLATIGVHWLNPNGTEAVSNYDPAEILTCTAAESIIKMLDAAHCVGKDTVIFQARCLDGRPSQPYVTFLKGSAKVNVLLNFREGIVSNAYAYLAEKTLCVFLNQDSPEILAKIEAVFTGVFPKTSLAP